MTPLPGQYEYCPGSDAISWAIRVLLLRGAVTADNSEAAPLKVGLLGLQNVMTSACIEFHTCAHASVVTAHFQLPISESDIANCSHILHKISCTTSLMVEANECAVTACTLIRATICLSKLPYTPA